MIPFLSTIGGTVLSLLMSGGQPQLPALNAPPSLLKQVSAYRQIVERYRRGEADAVDAVDRDPAQGSRVDRQFDFRRSGDAVGAGGRSARGCGAARRRGAADCRLHEGGQRTALAAPDRGAPDAARVRPAGRSVHLTLVSCGLARVPRASVVQRGGGSARARARRCARQSHSAVRKRDGRGNPGAGLPDDRAGRIGPSSTR